MHISLAHFPLLATLCSAKRRGYFQGSCFCIEPDVDRMMVTLAEDLHPVNAIRRSQQSVHLAAAPKSARAPKARDTARLVAL
eukprot:COSAG03_NODE_1442_length_4075_cov_3.438129_2_plen_82_part_00